MDNAKEDFRPADIDKKILITSNLTSQNKLFSKLSSIFKEMMFSESVFLASILVLDIRYKYLKSRNNNSFYLFNGQLDYALAHYFTDSKIIKCNNNKFLNYLLIKPITKNLSYCNTDK